MGLLVKSPNSVQNLGRERDKYIPNPDRIDLRSMNSYFKLGFILAAVLKSGEIINLNLPSLFWKHLLSNLTLINLLKITKLFGKT